MDPPSRRLARPISGVWILLIAVVILGLILLAAYHGSGSSSTTGCPPARGLLHRASVDATAARSAMVSTGQVPPAEVARLQKDDDDVNNLLNAQQSDQFTTHVLPLADDLGRAVTSLQDHSGATIGDLGQLTASARTAAQFCGASPS